jgi:hypothetical protein
MYKGQWIHSLLYFRFVELTLNTKGEIAIPCVYDDANYFFEGLAKVKQNGKWMIIDSNGQVIIPECDMSATSWSKVE